MEGSFPAAKGTIRSNIAIHSPSDAVPRIRTVNLFADVLIPNAWTVITPLDSSENAAPPVGDVLLRHFIYPG